MKTIDEIKAKCEIFPHDAVGTKKEHWVWQGAKNKNGGQPMCRAIDYAKDPAGVQMTQPVRRAIRQLQTGAPIKKGIGGWRVCNVEDCVSPDCTRWLTKAAYGKFLVKTGRHRGLPGKTMAALKRWEGRRIVTPDMRQIILNDKRPSKVLALDLGIHHTTVQWHRSGRARPAGNPFAGLFSGLLLA